ncbi:protein phosphatase 2C domain-containing protein [Kovacikia minuta CCNUW1]|uniref:protein phosphatase 2C domain-containing protein n=1 Tax=Kovacikia minuta TaxID=2931930 RepID=UPI001CC95644|nr:protein phosphatase 2C domain-containing protein [Kovacikia minuta]UBF26619.1 protein phosphatase 2C domain-containing protein [Kovacikia minuta CCNUW1]
MKGLFEIAAGSVIGKEHSRVGKNNQDAYCYRSLSAGVVAVVCDGCSSGTHSEVGAKLGAPIVADVICEQLTDSGSPALYAEAFWEQVRQSSLVQLDKLLNLLGGDRVCTVRDYLLFTVVGVVLAPTETVLFAIGDGVIALNDEVISLPSFLNNAPPYLSYGLISSAVAGLTSEDLKIQVHHRVPTRSVQSILIGTDGVQDAIAAANHPLPGKSESVGKISQFWEDDRYFKNPDCIRRRLTQMNHTITKPDWEARWIRQEGGLLPDDTTMVVIRRREKNEG